MAPRPPHSGRARDDAGDVKLADAVRGMLRGLRWSRLAGGCLDGLSKGYAALEVRWATDGGHWRPAEVVLQPQEDFCWRDRELFYRSMVGAEPEPLESFRWIVHCPEILPMPRGAVGLGRIVAWALLMKRYSLADWAQFLEAYGMPIRVGRYDDRATPEDRSKLLRAVRSIGSDSAAIVPENMPIEFVEASRAPAQIYEEACRYLDEQVSKAVLGQTMTADSGSSEAQAKVHDDVRQDVREADAAELADTLQEQLVEPYIALNHGIQDAYPRLLIPLPRSEDREGLVSALKGLVPMGLRVEASVVRDRLGLPEPADGAEVLKPPQPEGPGMNAASHIDRIVTAAAAEDRDVDEDLDPEMAGELGEWRSLMEPVVDPVRRALAAARTPEEFARALASRKLAREMDSSKLVASLARLAFQARGAGDAAA